MQTKHIAQATAQVLQSYLTYQALRSIQAELMETNPPQAIWLSHYAASHNLQDGEAFLEGLLGENKELVLRILTVREHLAEAVLDFLPAMVRSGIAQANTERRRHLLERLTQLLPDSQDRESDSPNLPPP